MDKVVLRGCNTATDLFVTRGAAWEAAVYHIQTQMDKRPNDPLVINEMRDYWVVGTEHDPEMFQVFYHVCPEGAGWVFDAIP